jgi:hypothetical protein
MASEPSRMGFCFVKKRGHIALLPAKAYRINKNYTCKVNLDVPVQGGIPH